MDRQGTLTRSRAFREASLRTEAYRAYAVIAVTFLIGIVFVAQVASRPREFNPNIVGGGGAGIATILGIQLGVLAQVRSARRRGRAISSGWAYATLIVECLIPTGIIVWQIVAGSLEPFAEMSAPPLLMYGLIILLSTLRLRPAMCLVAGAVCAGSYAGLLAHNVFVLGIRDPSTGLPLAAYINSVAIIGATGVAGAWVAREIRRNLEAALSEAEARNRVARMEADLATARRIQQALLPRGAPEIAGYDIAGWNQSADQTGGDYFDWLELPGGGWLITLADVSGHGIGPALVTAECRAFVRGSGSSSADLASLMERMNRTLAADLPDGRFVTMAAVLINPPERGLRLLSAGHGPILRFDAASGVVHDIMPRDLPLGVLADSNFGPDEAVELRPGDVLALVTDGFVEWSREAGDGRQEQFGTARLRESLMRHAGRAASEIIRSVAADVSAFAGGEAPQDDLTMVVIKAV